MTSFTVKNTHIIHNSVRLILNADFFAPFYRPIVVIGKKFFHIRSESIVHYPPIKEKCFGMILINQFAGINKPILKPFLCRSYSVLLLEKIMQVVDFMNIMGRTVKITIFFIEHFVIIAHGPTAVQKPKMLCTVT